MLSSRPRPAARRTRTPARLFAALATLGLLVHAAHTGLGLGGHGADAALDEWLYNALMIGAAAACLLRGARGVTDRGAWLLLGAGALSWSLGDLVFSLVFAGRAEPPFPSVSDALYLAWYPACWAALALLVRAHVREFPLSLGVDAVTGALAVCAIAAAVLYDAVRVTIAGEPAAIAVTLAYPVGDVLSVAFVVGLLALTGWRPGRTWALVAGALVLSALGDAAYLYRVAAGTYAEGTLLDSVWPASLLLLAVAAWRRPRFEDARLESRRILLMPTAFGLAAMALLVLAQVHPLNPLAVALACATIGALLVRMAVTLAENLRMVAASRGEALTDALTGLGNRRRLLADLDEALEDASHDAPRILLLFDLDGFKAYNDSFGHLAGDALLARLGAKLTAAVGERGAAYRLGGDEFCALATVDSDGLEDLLAGATGALADSGEGFVVTSSYGAVLLPHEADEPTQAMQLADQRMYRRKDGRTSPVRRQTRDVLVRALRARDPEVALRAGDGEPAGEDLAGTGEADVSPVAEQAVSVARRLGVTGEELDEIARAAELHDVGKVAVPDAILDKADALDDEEWAFMRRHTILGERILNGAPAMRPVARLVRSTHERFDGTGYPDGLRGAAIPLGARVVAVVDAYTAMTTGRPYRDALDHDGAAGELRAAAGTQFDPRVVEAFLAERERRAQPGGVAAAEADQRRAVLREVADHLREALNA